MISFRTALSAACLVAASGLYLPLSHETATSTIARHSGPVRQTSPTRPPGDGTPAANRPATTIAGSTPATTAPSATVEPAANAESLPTGDTTGLLRPASGIDEILDEFDRDLGVAGVPVDRERLASELRADPGLADAARYASVADESPDGVGP